MRGDAGIRLRAAAAWINTFVHRQDDFYVHHDGWNYPTRRPLTPADVVSGLDGTGPTVSILFLRDDNTAKVVAVDADGDDGWVTVHAIALVLLSHGIPCAIERSRRGGHLWLAVDKPLPAVVIRHAVLVAIAEAGHNPTDAKIEVRPASDTLQSPYGGGQLRGPMMPHRETGETWPLLDPSTLEPLGADWCEAVGRFPVADPDAITRLASAWQPPTDAKPASQSTRKPYAGQSKVAAYNAAMSIWDVLNLYFPGVLRGQSRQARCPFHDDRHASLSIYAGGTKVKCHADGCILAARSPETAYGLALLCKEVGR